MINIVQCGIASVLTGSVLLLSGFSLPLVLLAGMGISAYVSILNRSK